MPEVRHYKAPGGGYRKTSPLFKKEKAWGRLSEAGLGSLAPRVSTALRCIINLVTQFFVVYALLFLVQTLNYFRVIRRESEQKALVTVAETVYFVPMLCVLFLATRMRAVQLARGRDTEKYNLPQWWVRDSMAICSWAVLALTIIAFASAMAWGDMWEAAARSGSLGQGPRFMLNAKNVALTVVYASFSLVCIGLVFMPAPVHLWGESGGPIVSPTILCTVLLSVLYFAVYLALAFAKAWNEMGFGGPPQRFGPAQELLKTATMTVAFAPMLCVLFISVRLRAAQMYDSERGDPPVWMQAAFYVCAFSVVAQTLMAFATRGSQDIIVHEGGHIDVIAGKRPGKGVIALEGAGLVAKVCLYTAVTAVLVGFLLMGGGDSPPMPVSLECVLVLTALYFAVYFAIWVVLALQRHQDSERLAAARAFLENRARESVSFCPMFCILHVGALMRALQITGGAGAPGGWCQDVQCVATACIFVLTAARLDTAMPPSKLVPQRLTSVCAAVHHTSLCVLYACAIALVVFMAVMTPEQAHGPGSVTLLAMQATPASISPVASG